MYLLAAEHPAGDQTWIEGYDTITARMNWSARWDGASDFEDVEIEDFDVMDSQELGGLSDFEREQDAHYERMAEEAEEEQATS